MPLSRALRVALLAGAALAASGCGTVGLTMIGVAAGSAAVGATTYTLDGIAYRTFAASLADVRRAIAVSLRRMAIVVSQDDATDEGQEIVAEAGDRVIHIELERLTERTTRMRVTARYAVVLRDRATAGEIIAQTEEALGEVASYPAGAARSRR